MQDLRQSKKESLEKKIGNKLLFVVNPIAGRAQKLDYKSIISDYSKEYNFQYEIFETSGKNDRRNLRTKIDEIKPDTVISAGGDGTINMIATELLGSNINLGIIPNGSANGLAYNLTIPNAFEEALQMNLNGTFKPIDAIRINQQHYCFHLGDIGINARIVKRFEREGSKGILGYTKQFFKEMFSARTSFSFSLNAPEIKKKSKAEMLVIANAESYGTGVRINAGGNLADGKFEIVVIKPYPWWFIFTFMFSGYSGKLHKAQYVDVFKLTKASIQLNKKQDFQIDGEIIGKLDHLELEIIPAALNIIYD